MWNANWAGLLVGVLLFVFVLGAILLNLQVDNPIYGTTTLFNVLSTNIGNFFEDIFSGIFF